MLRHEDTGSLSRLAGPMRAPMVGAIRVRQREVVMSSSIWAYFHIS